MIRSSKKKYENTELKGPYPYHKSIIKTLTTNEKMEVFKTKGDAERPAEPFSDEDEEPTVLFCTGLPQRPDPTKSVLGTKICQICRVIVNHCSVI